jgi:hypothetical protein
MSNIKIKKNVLSNEWIVSELNNDHNYNYIDIHIGFYNNNSNIVEFNTLKFGCELYLNDMKLDSKNYPPENINMFKTQSEYLQVIRFNCEASTTYKIKVWIDNFGVYEDKFITFTTPTIPDYVEEFKLYHNGKSPDDLI